MDKLNFKTNENHTSEHSFTHQECKLVKVLELSRQEIDKLKNNCKLHPTLHTLTVYGERRKYNEGGTLAWKYLIEPRTKEGQLTIKKENTEACSGQRSVCKGSWEGYHSVL